MMKSLIKTLLIVVLVFSFSKSFSQQPAQFFTKADVFFKSYVSDGKVAYKEIKENPALLQELINLAKDIQVTKDNASEYQSFWINTYNLFVISEVIKNYPIKTPLDVKGFFDSKTHDIAGEQITLNDIENKKLRAQFNNDPRFHFVLVCAGLGCPPIINEAYVSSKLEDQLNRQTVLALNNDKFIKVNVKKKKVGLSQIFEWYKSDFTANDNTIIDFINLYRTNKIPGKVKTSFYEYNWNLNITQN